MTMAPWILLLLSFFSISKVLANDPSVKITSTDPRVRPVDGVIVQQRGKDVLLTCVVEDKPINSKVQWTVSNRNMSNILIASATKTEDAFRWAVDNPSTTEWRLRIQNVQEIDEGEYTCKVEVISHNDVLDRRTVRVVQSPQIKDLDTSTDMMKKTGKSATLECDATGRPEPVIRWTRLAGELLPNGGSVLQSKVLFIADIKSNDAGYYKCTASNFAGKDERLILLTVQFKPEVETTEMVVKQKVGYVKQLVCNIKGYPVPSVDNIAWQKEGRTLKFDERVRMRNIKGAYNRITSIVDIRGVQSKDYGRYKCAAENDRGSGEAYLELVSSPIPTEDRSNRIVSSVSMTVANIGLSVGMVLITILLQHFDGRYRH